MFTAISPATKTFLAHRKCSVSFCSKKEGRKVERKERKNKGGREEGREDETQIEIRGIQVLGVKGTSVWFICAAERHRLWGVGGLSSIPFQWPPGPISGVVVWQHFLLAPELHPPCMTLVPVTGKNSVKLHSSQKKLFNKCPGYGKVLNMELSGPSPNDGIKIVL